MIKRLVLTLALIAASLPAFAAGDCMSGLCGDWSSKDNGNFLVSGRVMVWNNHEFKQCVVMAQDQRVSIVKCSKAHNAGAEAMHDLVTYFYLRAVTPWSMQVIYSDTLPAHCSGDAKCWPSKGMFFYRIKDITNNSGGVRTEPRPIQ